MIPVVAGIAGNLAINVLGSLIADEIKKVMNKKPDNLEASTKYYDSLLKGWTESSKQYYQSVSRDLKNKMEETSLSLAGEGNAAKALQNKITGLDKAYEEIKRTMYSKGGYSQKERDIVRDRYLKARANLESLKEKEEKPQSDIDNKSSQCATSTAAEDAFRRTRELMRERARAEEEALAQWLESYKKSKMSETEIATDTYNEQLDKFYELLQKKKISQEEYDNFIELSTNDYNARLEEAEKKAIEDERRKLDEEKAMLAEIEAVKKNAADKDAENKKAAQELEWQLREAAAYDEEERLRIQMERMDARYDELAAKAKENADLLNQIERARIAEAERLENQLLQTRVNTGGQYASSLLQVANSAAIIGKAGGDKMKIIAIGEALINTALAATKAMTSAPWPLSLALAAGATASGLAQVATIQAQKFATGGVVGGNFYYGDRVPVMANSGEMILNKEQQKKLFNIANGDENDKRPQVNVTFAPNISPGMNSEDVKKMLRENQSMFRSFFASEVSKGLSSAGAFA